MLDCFKVPPEHAVRVPEDVMRATVEDMFQVLGMPQADARQAADVLLYADIRGIDSHGVSNMMRAYVAGLKSGQINPAPKWTLARDHKAAVTIDCDKGLGLVVGPAAMQVAIERARDYGVCAVTATNGRHYGAAAYHAQLAIAHDMIGISMTTGGLLVAPTYGAERMLGLNPLGVAAPAGTEAPFIFDASMSSLAANKIRLLQRMGGQVLPGWVAHPDGAPVMEEADVPENYLMLPLGGTREIGSHKGFGLCMMVEILAGLLSGGGGGPLRREGSAHYFMAYDVSAFTELETFKRDMDEYLRKLLECKPAPGHERVVYAGIPEHEEERDRRENGIPYHREVVDWFRETCAELNVADRFG
ncbi:MAG: Ldh family oxidoreductase [Gammaproteobacteria bacterium]|jgi:L-2-hydroxycarboxylate dehydrogenase (NAD+)